MSGNQRSFFPVPPSGASSTAYAAPHQLFGGYAPPAAAAAAPTSTDYSAAFAATQQQVRKAQHGPPPVRPLGGGAEDAAEWVEYLNDQGRPYYYNRATKQTTWEKPARFRPAAPKPKPVVPANTTAAVPHVWREYKNAEGRSYYHNTVTNETTWSRPEGFQSAGDVPRPQQHAPQQSQAPPQVRSELDKAMEATLKQLAPVNVEPSPVETTDPGTVKQRSNERFRELLVDKYRDNKIHTNMSWDQAVRYIQNDPRFDLVAKVSEKKRIFNEWKPQQVKDDRDARRLAVRRAKEELEAFLLGSARCRPSMSYGRADKTFREEALWKAVPETDRKDIFHDAMQVLKKRRDDQLKGQREQCQRVLDELLDRLPEITYRTTWAQTQRILAANDAYIDNDDLKQMDKLDALEVFMDYIRRAEKEHQKERDQTEKMRKREERKARDAFLAFLGELNRQGVVGCTSTWMAVYPRLRNDTRFQTMLSTGGSTPLDMFKFMVEDLKTHFHRDKRAIKQILERTGHQVTLETPFDQFEQWIRAEDRPKAIEQANLRVCFDQLLDKLAAKEKDYVKQPASKKEKRNDLPPMSALELVRPALTADSTWAESRALVLQDAALSDVEEGLVEQAFHDYLRVLKDRRREGGDRETGEVSDSRASDVEEGEVDDERSRSRSRSRHRRERKPKKAKRKKERKHRRHDPAPEPAQSSDDEAHRPRSRHSRKRTLSPVSPDRVKPKKAKKERR